MIQAIYPPTRNARAAPMISGTFGTVPSIEQDTARVSGLRNHSSPEARLATWRRMFSLRVDSQQKLLTATRYASATGEPSLLTRRIRGRFGRAGQHETAKSSSSREAMASQVSP